MSAANKIFKSSLAAILLPALALGLGACQSSRFSLSGGFRSESRADSTLLASGVGNGNGFEGRVLARYVYLDPGSPCASAPTEMAASPNQEIYLVSTAAGPTPELVRDGCADLQAPVPLTSDQVQLSGGAAGTLVFQGRTFNQRSPGGDFDLVSASCPGAAQSRVAPLRNNLFIDSLNLVSPSWAAPQGIALGLAGSLGGMPGFSITRNDFAYRDSWRRLTQKVAISAGKSYAISFLGFPGTLDQAEIQLDDEAGAFTAHADFNLRIGGSSASGTGFTRPGVGGNMSQTSRASLGGYFSTLYFTAPAGSTSVQVGFAPFNPNSGMQLGAVGDSVRITALQFEDVSDFCQ